MNKIFYALRKYNNKPSVFYIMNNDNIWWLESIMWKTGENRYIKQTVSIDLYRNETKPLCGEYYRNEVIKPLNTFKFYIENNFPNDNISIFERIQLLTAQPCKNLTYSEHI